MAKKPKNSTTQKPLGIFPDPNSTDGFIKRVYAGYGLRSAANAAKGWAEIAERSVRENKSSSQKYFANQTASRAAKDAAKAFDTALYAQYPALAPTKKAKPRKK